MSFLPRRSLLSISLIGERDVYCFRLGIGQIAHDLYELSLVRPLTAWQLNEGSLNTTTIT